MSGRTESAAEVYKRKLREEAARRRQLQSTTFDVKAKLSERELSSEAKRQAMIASRLAAQAKLDIAAAEKKESEMEKLIEKMNKTKIQEEKLRQEEKAMQEKVKADLQKLKEHNDKAEKRTKEALDAKMKASRMAFLDRLEGKKGGRSSRKKHIRK